MRAFSSDPYPSIPPALLNSADVEAYARHPNVLLFSDFDRSKLKSASYEIQAAGDVYFWRQSDSNLGWSQEIVSLRGAEEFVICPNQLVYVYPDVLFNIPEYLALRFNLQISLVHQGLLLGTGPLVDPGFSGRLLIPVYNFTNREVSISPHDGLIWVEVTKLSPWVENQTEPHAYAYVPFPIAKKGLTPSYYFRKASRGKAITTSISQTVEWIKVTEKELRGFSIAAAVTTGLAIAALVITAFQLFGLVQSANGRYDSVTSEFAGHKRRSEQQDGEIKDLKKEVTQLQEVLRKQKK